MILIQYLINYRWLKKHCKHKTHFLDDSWDHSKPEKLPYYDKMWTCEIAGFACTEKNCPILKKRKKITQEVVRRQAEKRLREYHKKELNKKIEGGY